ncbi:MAG TPA: hypothetical protein PLG90_06380 [Ignavibacteria bacterium]|nr:hypothetical protein [Ignavibacteria bacterium]
MKKINYFFLCFAVLIFLQGCSEKKDTSSNNSNNNSSTNSTTQNTPSSNTTENQKTGRQDFSITNKTGMTLIDVFISPNESNDWGEDVIPTDMIADGETFNFTFTDVSPDKCMWDIKFNAEDGVEYFMKGVNLCEISTITLNKQ